MQISHFLNILVAGLGIQMISDAYKFLLLQRGTYVLLLQAPQPFLCNENHIKHTLAKY